MGVIGTQVPPSTVARERLRAHRLTGTPARTPQDVVRHLGAVQSQEYAPAKLSIGLRMRAGSDADVERAYARGAILRTHVLRPTWHFVAPADIRWMLALTAPRIRAQLAGQHRRLEIDGRLVAKAATLVAAALEGGQHHTRAALQDVLARGRIDITGQRLGHLMMLLELDALICSGVPQGRQHTYALLDERAPGAASLDAEEALAELARRYFSSHGPATAKDFARWATLTLTDARRALAMLGADVEHVQVGDDAWYRAGTPPRRSPDAARAWLLQIYDEYIGGYGETRPVADPYGLTHVTPAVRLPFMHAVVLDGQVVGHWRPAQGKGDGPVDLKLARRLDADDRAAVNAAIERYRAFFAA